jgi:hypothetical protein
LKQLLKRGTAANKGIEIHLAADFVFQVQLLLRQLVFELGNLPVGQGIFHRDRNLRRHLADEIDLIPGKWVVVQPAEA